MDLNSSAPDTSVPHVLSQTITQQLQNKIRILWVQWEDCISFGILVNSSQRCHCKMAKRRGKEKGAMTVVFNFISFHPLEIAEVTGKICNLCTAL